MKQKEQKPLNTLPLKTENKTSEVPKDSINSCHCQAVQLICFTCVKKYSAFEIVSANTAQWGERYFTTLVIPKM